MFSHSTNTASFFSVLMAALISLPFLAEIAGAQTNTTLGTGALQNNTTGTNNTAVGGNALFTNNTGSNNTATGLNALLSNTTGTFNTANGAFSLLFNTTGDFNTATGAFTLASNTTGDFNTASGVSALTSNTTGNNNTVTGAQTLARNITGNNNTASGVNALASNTTGSGNTASGVSVLAFNTTGSANTASGVGALFSNTTGIFNTAIGNFADVSAGNLNNATAVGAGATVDASNKVRLGNGAVTVIEGQVAFTFPSDKTQKENFQPVDGEEVLEKIRGFELSSWNFIGHDPKEFRHYGPMAQDFFAAFGHDGVGQIGTETTINSGDLAGILMIAVQALENRTAELKQTKAQLAGLAARLEALELRQNHSIQIAVEKGPEFLVQ